MSEDRGEKAIRRRMRWGRGGSGKSADTVSEPRSKSESGSKSGSGSGSGSRRESTPRPRSVHSAGAAPGASPDSRPASPDDAASRPAKGPGPTPASPPDPAQTTDRELLARHVEGDADAFGEIVRRHRDRLWAVALRTLGDREEAADAVQDALISAYRAAHTFRGQSAVTTWLHRITVNACLDRARKAVSRRTSLMDDTERLDQLMEPHESASVPAEQHDLHRQLIAALSQLPAEQRAALVLVDMQGYPVAEAAEVLDIAVGTVKSRCARGRARLLPLVSHLRPNGENVDEGDTSPPHGGRNRAQGTSVPPPTGVPDPPGTVKGGGEQT